ncbi:hypothetical protein L1887_35090 [Cichorium endivia]|nr:hypothetical protein L1887_35090 [Cichorium endivia]
MCGEAARTDQEINWNELWSAGGGRVAIWTAAEDISGARVEETNTSLLIIILDTVCIPCITAAAGPDFVPFNKQF